MEGTIVKTYTKSQISGEVKWDNGQEVRFTIDNGELIALDLFANNAADFAELDSSELVTNLRKGIAPHVGTDNKTT